MPWFVAILLALTPPAAASQQNDLEALRRQISVLQQELEKTSESRSDASEALRASELAISDCNRRLRELEQQRQTAQHALEQARRQAQRLSASLKTQQDALARLFRQQYVGRQQAPLKLLLDSRNPNQLARELTYYRYLARQRSLWLEALRRDLAEQQQVSEDMRQQSETLASLRNAALKERQALEKEKKRRQHILNQIGRQLAQQRREISRLQRDENRLSQLVSQLGRMLNPPGSPSRNTSLPDARYDGHPFSALKGLLALPVKGEPANRYGDIRPESTLQWKGLFLRAAANQPVKAIAAGRVVFANWLRGFGNLLIIDHGEGYMSLYGNNETLYKQVGDILHGGEVIAAVGNSGGNEDSGLYFELRHEGKTVDPLPWMAR